MYSNLGDYAVSANDSWPDKEQAVSSRLHLRHFFPTGSTMNGVVTKPMPAFAVSDYPFLPSLLLTKTPLLDLPNVWSNSTLVQ
ncbi:unnamed protein product [Dibothriocephalus latus]|uniref:Uncharacterized protein n=1 Tax=Dibothriocephalus latus TaxID=60516 RepID=A0A3P7LTV2_DIBLA|nr:unnamed protein product [Dibothriocephalus latus]